MKHFCLSIALIACVLGCGKSGPTIAPVSGTVSLDGAPLTEGVVSFVSVDGYTSSAPLGPDGQFRLVSQYGEGMPLGEYRVTVLPNSPEPSELSMQGKQSVPLSKIPTKYQYPDRSGMTAIVDENSTAFNFQLSTRSQ